MSITNFNPVKKSFTSILKAVTTFNSSFQEPVQSTPLLTKFNSFCVKTRDKVKFLVWFFFNKMESYSDKVFVSKSL